MPVVIDEVQVEAVEPQAQPRDAQGHAHRSAGPAKIDPADLAAILRQRHQRGARLWAD
ncbi:MAG TPA: hypothetical protein VN694_09740 [Caulobacteraceae bacterium]|nr:hypothetical protein [Caulobacteraceae bacterium]